MKTKYIIISIVSISLTIILLTANFFSTENQAERAIYNLIEKICDFKEQNNYWPKSLSDLPAHTITTFMNVPMQYNQKELTVTAPVSIVDKDHIKNLWSIITRKFTFSQTTTTAITIQIDSYYNDKY